MMKKVRNSGPRDIRHVTPWNFPFLTLPIASFSRNSACFILLWRWRLEWEWSQKNQVCGSRLMMKKVRKSGPRDIRRVTSWNFPFLTLSISSFSQNSACFILLWRWRLEWEWSQKNQICGSRVMMKKVRKSGPRDIRRVTSWNFPFLTLPISSFSRNTARFVLQWWDRLEWEWSEQKQPSGS
jgi:hypothetical protein